MEKQIRSPHPYLSGNFAPIKQTRRLTRCTHVESIPEELAGGQYVRNGGNPITNVDLGRDAHWFDGDGMLTGVLFRREAKHRDIEPETLALVLLSKLPGSKRAVKKISVANTGVLYHDGRALATCESGPPLTIQLPSLETVGWYNGRRGENEGNLDTRAGFGGDGLMRCMKEWTTGHPRVDPITKELVLFHAVFVKPFVYYSIVPPTMSSAKRSSRYQMFNLPIAGVSSPKMMHDFGVSTGHTVIMDIPLSLDPMNSIRGKPVVSYDPTERSRYGVFPRYEPNKIQWYETNRCVVFHTANCWETTSKSSEGETHVHLLVCRLTSASVVYSAGAIVPPVPKPVPLEYAEEEQCRLYYYSFPFSNGKINKTATIRHQWGLSAIPFEFPTTSPSHSMSVARYIYGCSTGAISYRPALGKAAKIDYIAKIDAETLIAQGIAHPPQQIKGCVDTRSVDEIMQNTDDKDPVKLFRMPRGWFAQEPRFVQRANAETEDDGWLLTYVFDESQLNV
ncbi:hypothetical protein M434DRAFT_34559 [Hypoxylon sp. CO27-5]|nr:hypothetical protein M434DRAFT_34559 [Hypoxylon sp. CO27-5]